MPKIQSSVACEGTMGEYDLWTNYMLPSGKAVFQRLALRGNTSRIENDLDLPGISDPFVLLGFAEQVQGQSQWLRQVGLPAVTSVVRYCERAHHRDGATTERTTGRQEAVARIVWIPAQAGKLIVRQVITNDDNVGYALARTVTPSERASRIEPVVSAPLTPDESRYAATLGGAILVSAMAHPSHPLYAAVHPFNVQQSGMLVERLYVVPEDRMLEHDEPQAAQA